MDFGKEFGQLKRINEFTDRALNIYKWKVLWRWWKCGWQWKWKR